MSGFRVWGFRLRGFRVEGQHHNGCPGWWFLHLCMSVCQQKRARERERKKNSERERERESETESEIERARSRDRERKSGFYGLRFRVGRADRTVKARFWPWLEPFSRPDSGLGLSRFHANVLKPL